MSFLKEYECDSCGKNSVRYPGEICSECQEKDYLDNCEQEAKWYSKSSLCQTCSFAWGPDSSDTCGAYKMPLWMVARKHKCKRFKEITQEELNEACHWGEY